MNSSPLEKWRIMVWYNQFGIIPHILHQFCGKPTLGTEVA